jgi:RNA-directed DNA polymerase
MSKKTTLSDFQTRNDVAIFLGISNAKLRYFLYAKNRETQYYQFRLIKKSGGFRTISAPLSELKVYQKRFADLFLDEFQPKQCVFGFLKEKSNVDNAKKHLRKREVLNIDLKDFFDSINFGRVRGVLMAEPNNMGKEAATVIADLLCFNKKLPQGSPCSPILTNMICTFLDKRILKLISNSGIPVTYTRYADDLSFSSSRNLPSILLNYTSGSFQISEKLETCIRECGFEIQHKKVRIAKKYARQEVTGIIVNEKLNVEKNYIKELRGLLYYSLKFDQISVARKYIEKNNLTARFANHTDEYILRWFRLFLMGRINYLLRVRGKSDRISLRFAAEFNKLYCTQTFNTTRLDRINWLSQECVYVVYEKGFTEARGTAFLLKGIGAITSKHVIEECDNRVQLCKVRPNGDLLKVHEVSVSEFYISDSQDYAILSLQNVINGFEFDSSRSLDLDGTYHLVGYPDFRIGNKVSINTCNLTSLSIVPPVYTGISDKMVTINREVVAGSSGGPVLNDELKVIGITTMGVETGLRMQEHNYHGFIKISSVIDEYRNFLVKKRE